MEDDKFSILEKVRQAGSKLDNPLTLSIGYAHDFPDVSKLNEMATNALDVALSRGGDQAVVSQYGSELRFFGGKTAAVETTSKVKVRSVADSIVSLIKSSSNVYVMISTAYSSQRAALQSFKCGKKSDSSKSSQNAII